MAGLLRGVGLPVNPARRVVHVAGTKGKGTVCAHLERLARLEAGMSTGLFTSPHLIHPRERTRINGTSLLLSNHSRLLANVKSTTTTTTFFRTMQMVSWAAMREAGVELAVVEAGIGGRYDSTNVVHPDLSVITAIHLDHLAMLGPGIKDIAWHKAGIIKEGRPCITCHQLPDAMQVIREEARLKNAELFIAPTEYMADAEDVNKCLALHAHALLTRRPISRMMERVVEGTRWYGRRQIVSEGGFREWYLDGAHTVESVRGCVHWFQQQQRLTDKLTLVFHCSAERSYTDLLAPLTAIPWTRALFIPPTSTDGSAGRHQEMADWFQQYAHAQVARSMAEVRGAVLVTGSLHLVGDALAHLHQNLDQI